jgi:hypothetical protein
VNSNIELKNLWNEISSAIESISDEKLKTEFAKSQTKMSLSDSINRLLDEELVQRGWTPQSAIFTGEEYSDKKWRLDFSKRINNPDKGITGMAIEVAFNHGEAIAWNLMKPVLAAELNQVELQTEIGSGIGIYICATDELKSAGGFDGAVGEYEKVLRYLNPMFQKLSVPLIIVGLNAPETFRIEKRRNAVTNRNVGVVVDF